MNLKRLATAAFSAVVAGTLALSLAACSSQSPYKASDSNAHVKLGVTKDYHKDIAEVAADLDIFSKYGISVDIVEYDSCDEALSALDNRELDAAFTTDVFRVEAFNDSHDANLTEKGSLTFGRMGAYSKKYTALSELPDGATVGIADTAVEYLSLIHI